MAEAVDPQTIASPEFNRTKDSLMATSVIGAHALEHMYGRAFLVLIPQIYIALGLAPIQAGLLDAVRQLSGGATSMSGGFFVDMFQHRRAHILAFSMSLIAVGYFLVSIAPNFGLILAALALASAGSALWHPPALGLLAQRFPSQRGLFISMHRSTGSHPATAFRLLPRCLGRTWRFRSPCYGSPKRSAHVERGTIHVLRPCPVGIRRRVS